MSCVVDDKFLPSAIWSDINPSICEWYHYTSEMKMYAWGPEFRPKHLCLKQTKTRPVGTSLYPQCWRGRWWAPHRTLEASFHLSTWITGSKFSVRFFLKKQCWEAGEDASVVKSTKCSSRRHGLVPSVAVQNLLELQFRESSALFWLSGTNHTCGA